MKFKLFIKRSDWDAALFVYDDEGKAVACNCGRWADDIGATLYYLRHTDKTLEEMCDTIHLYDADWVKEVEQEYNESTSELVLTEEGECPHSNSAFLDQVLWEEEKRYVQDKLNGFSIPIPAHAVCYFTYGDTEGLEDREVEWLKERYSDYVINRIGSHLDPFMDRYLYNGTLCDCYEALVTPRPHDKKEVQEYLESLRKKFAYICDQLHAALLYTDEEAWDKLSEVISSISIPPAGVFEDILHIQKAIKYITTNKSN